MEENGHRWITVICGGCLWQKRVFLSCGDRTCPVCRKNFFGRHFELIARALRDKGPLISLTLTKKNIFSDRLRGEIRKLRSDFKRLSKELGYSGGVYIIHITNKGHGWHIHLHCLVQGPWHSQAEISKRWERLSGAKIVWVRRVEQAGLKKALRYLLSEMIKKPAIEPGAVEVYNRELRGVRLVQGFGAVKIKKEPGRCPICGGSLFVLEFLELNCRVLYDELLNGGP